MLSSLSHLAFLGEKSIGRRRSPDRPENPSSNDSDPFAIDIAAIRSSKAWGRLGENGVFPIGFGGCTCDCISYAKAIARHAREGAEALGLNASLAEAIAYLSNLGNMFFGHDSERFLSEKLGQPLKGRYFGIWIADEIENQGSGLNLSYEVMRGAAYQAYFKKENCDQHYEIEGHSQEAVLVAYLGKIVALLECYRSDGCREDSSLESKSLSESGSLHWLAERLGHNYEARIRACCGALKEESLEYGKISFRYSKEARILFEMREIMNERIYSYFSHFHHDAYSMRWNMLQVLYEFYYKLFAHQERNFSSSSDSNAKELSCKEAVLALSLLTGKEASSLFVRIEANGGVDKLLFNSDHSKLPIAEFYPYIRKLAHKNFWEPDIRWGKRLSLFYRLEAKKRLSVA